MMNYGVLSNKELAVLALQDPRYGVDPLFTALTNRVEGVEPGVHGVANNTTAHHKANPALKRGSPYSP